jgi:hypothetical protein
MLDYSKADEYMKKYPKRPFTAFDKDFPNSGITSSSYCRRRIKVLAGKNLPSKGTNKGIDYTIIDNLFKETPELTFMKFKAMHPNFTISDAMFYNRRRLIVTGQKYSKPGTEKRSYTRSNNALYMTVWSKPVESLGTAQDVLNDLIQTINNSQKLHWELIELKNPPCLEIRQKTR